MSLHKKTVERGAPRNSGHSHADELPEARGEEGGGASTRDSIF